MYGLVNRGSLIYNDFIQPFYENRKVSSYWISSYKNLFGEKETKPEVVDPGDGEKVNFNRTVPLERNDTLDITSPTPAEILENQLFAFIRIIDDDFTLSLSSYADETVYFEIDVIDVYNGSVADVVSADKEMQMLKQEACH